VSCTLELMTTGYTRVAIATLLIAAVVATACMWRNKSGSQNVSAGTGGTTHQDVTASTVAASPSPQTGYITDSANVMDRSSRTELETTLDAFKRNKKIDFAVVTVGTTGDRSVFDYSLDLARERKTTVRDGRDNGGLLLLVAVNDRKWHIQITRNLEDKLTAETLTTLSRPMADSFKQKRYGEGIIKYVNAIISKLDELD
jgi:uncharacterized membrane protein YgcG